MLKLSDYKCPECGNRLVEDEGFYSCVSCGNTTHDTPSESCKIQYETIDIDFGYEEYFKINEEARKLGLLLDDYITMVLEDYIYKNKF